MNNHDKRKLFRGNISIMLKMLTYLALFAVISLFIVWLFQVKLLNTFYERSKSNELQDAEKILAGYIEDRENLEKFAYKFSMDYTMGIAVYRIDGAIPHEIYHRDVGFDSIIANMSDRDILDYYNRAIDNDGTYKTHQNYKSNKQGNNVIGTVTNTLYVGVERDSNDNSYVIILDAQTTPHIAMINTQRLQFMWVVICILDIAVIMALAISKRIIRPIVRINESAKTLARGDYSVRFEGGGYLEVTQLSETLNYAASELAKADNLQKELIANVSHDLRTPLTMIEGYVEMMRDIPGENTPENLQVIIDESQRLNELVNDLLDLSRLRAGTRKIQCEQFNLTDTVHSVMNRYDKLTHHDGYKIEYKYDRSVDVFADRTGILQVVYNLINNAINYTGDDKYVCVTQTAIGDKVRLSICDHGGGIPADQIPMIWDRYYKVDSVHKRATVGTGLGLSIVKGVLEMHGFVYGVESKLGEGSIFWFEMPVVNN